MDWHNAIELLPEPYRRGLRLREEGVGDAAIAAAVDVQPEALDAFLALAEAKLRRIVQRPVGNAPEGRGDGTCATHHGGSA
jgi:DNA-directed RNA polymerase specialized sigma24 family protein